MSPAGPSVRTSVIVFDDVHMGRTTVQTAKRARPGLRRIPLGPGDRVSLGPHLGRGVVARPNPRGPTGSPLRPQASPGPSPSGLLGRPDLRLRSHAPPPLSRPPGPAAITRRYAGPSGSSLGRAVRWVAPAAEQRGDPGAHGHPRPDGGDLPGVGCRGSDATYDVLRQVAVALQAARGRKSILFLSEGFVQEPGLREHRDTVQAAQRANAAIHFLDARASPGSPRTLMPRSAPPLSSRT